MSKTFLQKIGIIDKYGHLSDWLSLPIAAALIGACILIACGISYTLNASAEEATFLAVLVFLGIIAIGEHFSKAHED